MSKLSKQEQCTIERFLNEGASRVEVWDEHWVYGGDGGISYCHECCQKEVGRLKAEDPEGEYMIDGGWGSESDGTPFCETCHKRLSASLTTCGCEQEIDHFEYAGFDIDSDCDRWSMNEVIQSLGWGLQNDSNNELYMRLHRLCRKILGQINERGRDDANSN